MREIAHLIWAVDQTHGSFENCGRLSQKRDRPLRDDGLRHVATSDGDLDAWCCRIADRLLASLQLVSRIGRPPDEDGLWSRTTEWVPPGGLPFMFMT
jgi:hypothetical protein